MKFDKFSKFMIASQMLILASLWLGQSLPAAHALDLPDPGIQREKQLDELRKLNDKMDKLLDVLSSGKVQVKLQKVDDK